jgi:hypothetical protein
LLEDVDPELGILGIVVLAASPSLWALTWLPWRIDTESARFEVRRANTERWEWVCGEDAVMVCTEDVSEGLRVLFCCWACWERCLYAYAETGRGTGWDMNSFLVVVVIALSRASAAAM